MPIKFERSSCQYAARIIFVSLLSLTFLLLTSLKSSAGSQSVSLAWDGNSDASVVGYIVYMGTASGYYPIANNVGQATNATVSGLQPGEMYFFVVTAYTASGLESSPSEEIVYLAPSLAPKIRISMGDGAINVKFSAVGGKTYMVEYKNSLDEPEWTVLTSIAGTDGELEVNDDSPVAASRFYRVGVR